MQLIFKYHNCSGFARLYDYANKHGHMVTKEAQQRIKILDFWRCHGLKATKDAYGVRRSTLYLWQKILRDKGVEGLSPGSQARKNNNRRIIDSLLLVEIKRLRLEVCPNMGKAKLKIFLDQFSEANGLTKLSESKIGRIIKDKKIYHQRQKVSHFGKIKVVARRKRLRKPNDLIVTSPGELVEIDTVIRFVNGLKRYIVTAIDTYGRPAFAWCYTRASSANTKDFFQKLQMALPFVAIAVQTDNGSEFHQHFMNYLNEQDVTHYWNYPGRPYRNGHIEKFNRTIQEEFIDWHEAWLDNTAEFNVKLVDWLIWYNTKRPHWSLRLQSPFQFLLNNGHLSKMRWTDTST